MSTVGVSPQERSDAGEVLDTLLHAVQELSLARDIDEIQRIVRTAARRLVGADGATFVLRDGSQCFYADEDAIEPLWKGQRFPLEACVSGWAMLNREVATIPDIYADDRVPHDAYRPTFVKSMLMVPIRRADPLGAIGMYWAEQHEPSAREISAGQALADSTAVALEHVLLRHELHRTEVLSQTDPLTGLPNRRAWDELLDGGPPAGGGWVGLVDLDDFKGYNDARGHQAGDELLRSCAAAWTAVLRPGDVVARLGGDEFGLLLHGCDADAADGIGARLRAVVGPGASASAGLVRWDAEEPGADVVARADAALYAAKAAGRDTVVRR
jgi:diguanylate cyclase (GGDEF)-like protein